MDTNELLKDILEALRDLPMEVWTKPELALRLAGYSDAVCKVCNLIEDTAHQEDLSCTGIPITDLNYDHSLGEHLAATRRQFGMIS